MNLLPRLCCRSEGFARQGFERQEDNMNLPRS